MDNDCHVMPKPFFNIEKEAWGFYSVKFNCNVKELTLESFEDPIKLGPDVSGQKTIPQEFPNGLTNEYVGVEKAPKRDGDAYAQCYEPSQDLPELMKIEWRKCYADDGFFFKLENAKVNGFATTAIVIGLAFLNM